MVGMGWIILAKFLSDMWTKNVWARLDTASRSVSWLLDRVEIPGVGIDWIMEVVDIVFVLGCCARAYFVHILRHLEVIVSHMTGLVTLGLKRFTEPRNEGYGHANVGAIWSHFVRSFDRLEEQNVVHTMLCKYWHPKEKLDCLLCWIAFRFFSLRSPKPTSPNGATEPLHTHSLSMGSRLKIKYAIVRPWGKFM